MIRSCCYRTAV